MLANSPVVTTLPAVDISRAERFYADKLGLKEVIQKTDQGGKVFEAGRGTRVELVPRDQPTKADHTALTFEVPDVDREVADLEGRGIRFEDYDMPGLKTERHIAKIGNEKAAWFKDTEGNILCVHGHA